MKKYTLIAFTLLALPLMAAQPSFNCSNATTVTEKTICNSPKLSTYDDEMAKLYRSLRTKGLTELRKNQKNWALKRDACELQGEVKSCIATIYHKRVRELLMLWLEKHQENHRPYDPFTSLEEIMVSGETVTYLIYEFQYIYGSLIEKYWMATFNGKLQNKLLICKLVTSEGGEVQQGEQECDADYAKKKFLEGA